MDRHFTPDNNTLLEGIPSPAMVLNKRFGIAAMNGLMESLTGYRVEQVRGVHGELVVRSNVGNNRGQQFTKVLKEGKRIRLPGDVLGADRKKLPVQLHIAPLADQERQEQGLLVIIAEDVSPKTVVSDREVGSLADLIGHSRKMQKVFDMAKHMAHTDASILVTGETGTGKDKIAEVIHQNSSRAKFPFIKINCGALPEGLLESELFGHVKGAFTGATRNKAGMFELADKGTLFLTEIGDMPLSLQVKLLSVLDDRRFVPVGGERSIDVDIRLIAATHRPLREQVRRGEFREDLYYRLNVLHLHLPPLRERDDDIKVLLEHFLAIASEKFGKSILGYQKEALEPLLAHRYPGNIREMTNIVEYAVHMCRKEAVGREHLPPYLFEKYEDSLENQKRPTETQAQAAEKPARKNILPSTPEAENVPVRWNDIERQMIVEALKEYGGSRSAVMEKLGWNRMKLWRKMKKYGLL